MCGRYTLATPNPADIRARFPVGESIEIARRYNVAPGDDVLAVTTSREGEPRGELLRWGLVPSWAKTPATGLKMINARVETVAERPAFRRAFERFRCLIIADGFYEWRRMPNGPKQAFHITRDDGELFSFAGLWSIWHGEDERTMRSCTIMTTAANSAIAALHDRMPVILERMPRRPGSTPPPHGGELERCSPASRPAQTALHAVGPAVNDARYDGPECLAPPVEPQASLF